MAVRVADGRVAHVKLAAAAAIASADGSRVTNSPVPPSRTTTQMIM